MSDSPTRDAKDKALLLCGLALDKKAQDLVLLEVGELTTIAEYFLICSGRSDRHVQSIAEGIREDGRVQGVRPLSSEGVTRGQWVLMDFSDVLVHVFYQPVRGFYDLDGLWGGAKVVELPEPHATLAAQFTSAGDPADPWPAVEGVSGPGYFGKPVR
ncbi:MAG: ribosome silencing factor [Deltaproteobacteria bacterium]|nr:ribosome silencing factor [Deltaproteobacteria bacterium]